MTRGILVVIAVIVTFMGSAQSTISQVDSLLKFYYNTDALNGCILVAKDNKIIFEKAYGYANYEWKIKNTINTKFRTASISKLFTTVLCFQLFEKGIINPEHTISKYFPGFPNGNGITIHQLLTHTSGLIDHRDIKRYDDDFGMTRKSRTDWMKIFKDSTLKFEPGTGWYYSNFGYNVLAAIIEKAAGKSFEEVLMQYIFQPTGMTCTTTMEHTGVIENLASGYERTYAKLSPAKYYDGSGMAGAGSVISTVRDLYSFFRALREDKLISKENTQNIYSKLFKDEYGDSTGYNSRFFSIKTAPNDSTEFAWFSGNHAGTHALIYNSVANNTLVILLLNIKTARLFEIVENVLYTLFKVRFEWPKDSYVRLFAKDIEEKGIETAIRRFKKNKALYGNSILQKPRDLNRLGYFYLDNGNTSIAIEIFKLNLEYYPEADFFDSLGEAYMQQGDKEKAIENLSKAYKMDPSNEHAKALLDQLMK